MATLAEADEPQQTVTERVTRVVTAPVDRWNRSITLVAIAAGAGTFAPQPAALILAMTLVIAASDLARKR